MTKIISFQDQWGEVSSELSKEKIKLQSYDKTLLELLGDVHNKQILDYGSGPGILASMLDSLGACVKVFDISESMLEAAAQMLGEDNVYYSNAEIPCNEFDVVICNLVVCIVSEIEVVNICHNIRHSLKVGGLAYIGFCNPHIFGVKESQLDFRFPTGDSYCQNHDYKKVKKEGGYEIVEKHRPLEWYNQIFEECHFNILSINYTQPYTFKKQTISDFTIVVLQKLL